MKAEVQMRRTRTRLALVVFAGVMATFAALPAAAFDPDEPDAPGSNQCGGSNVTIWGTNGHDIGSNAIYGTPASDVIDGKGGGDDIFGGGGSDKICGRDGNDSINGNAGADQLWGNSGYDQLQGGDNNDTIRGGGADDDLNDGNGQDFIFGGSGQDVSWPCYGDGYPNQSWAHEGDGIDPGHDNFYDTGIVNQGRWQPQPCAAFWFPLLG